MTRVPGPRAVARATDPKTSWDAARSVKDLLLSQQIILGAIIAYGPISDEDIHAALKNPMSASGARTRRKELVDKGLVQDSGHRTKTRSGRQTILWEANHEKVFLHE